MKGALAVKQLLLLFFHTHTGRLQAGSIAAQNHNQVKIIATQLDVSLVN